MRRIIVLLAGLFVLAGFAVATVLTSSDPAPIDRGVVDREPKVVAVPAPPPKPKFSRVTYASTVLDGSDALLDECKGPVAVRLGADRPVLVAEHDYCGGSTWISAVKVGDAVKLAGEGIEDGIFVVTSLTYETRHEVTVGDLPDADAVLQTCVTKTKLVLAGLERFDPYAAA